MKNRNLILYFLCVITATAFGSYCATGHPEASRRTKDKIALQKSKTIYLPAKFIEPLTPKNTAFLWDFHDVIVKRNLKKTVSRVWNSKNKFQILKNTNLKLYGKLLGMAGKSITSSACSEELIQLVKASNNPLLEELIYQVANIQEPIPGTVALIEELHRNGYKHYIGSNIGASIFDQIINPIKYPQFVSLFFNFDLSHPQTVYFDLAHPEKSIKKPDIRFYKQFLRKNTIDLKTTNIIFIDDRLKNVVAAQKAGMIGIHFLSPEQLRTDLELLLNVPQTEFATL